MFGKIWEKISIDGNEYTMKAEPLEMYFNKNRKKPFVDWLNAACTRGYIGTWKITDDKLFLTELVAFGDTDPKVNLQLIFPKQSTIFADWYSGDIKIYSGEYLLPFKDKTDDPLFENEMTYTFKRGKLIKSLIEQHRVIHSDIDDYLGSSYSTERVEHFTSKN